MATPFAELFRKLRRFSDVTVGGECIVPGYSRVTVSSRFKIKLATTE